MTLAAAAAIHPPGGCHAPAQTVGYRGDQEPRRIGQAAIEDSNGCGRPGASATLLRLGVVFLGLAGAVRSPSSG
ncbi:hypothetical protein DB459_23590 [Bradyrhizobium sp. WD16]|nr:hypothetical protein DB459_23590 [Bradyrhizobium sp. WD16]